MTVKILALLLVATFCAPASAEFVSVSEFKARGGINSVQNAAYLIGISHGIAVANGFAQNAGQPLYCPPDLLVLDGFLLWQLVDDAVIEFPELNSEGLANIAMAAVERGFPCP